MAYNLMDNAIRYNHPGGRVDVALARTKNAVWLTVADTGPGIPPEARKKVFERFYRLEEGRSRETGGTGLGLAIVKHTAQRYGGTVAVSGNEAGGSTFTVSLPAAPQVI
jgi:two-component system phosphate regulon sensor histidine kinase PhoR